MENEQDSDDEVYEEDDKDESHRQSSHTKIGGLLPLPPRLLLRLDAALTSTISVTILQSIDIR